MKVEIDRNAYNMLFAIFQLSNVHDTLDDISDCPKVIGNLKESLDNFRVYLDEETRVMLEVQFKIDEAQFEAFDRAVAESSKNFFNEGFMNLFTIID
jgi:hypothetical protein